MINSRLHKIAAILLVSAIFASTVLTSCSEKLPDETAPTSGTGTSQQETETEPPETETTTETTESATESTEPTEAPKHGPQSTAVVTDKVVEKYGKLQVIGTDLCDSEGNPVQLRGMSTYGLNNLIFEIDEPFVQTMAEDWGCSVFRLAMHTWGEVDSYMLNPEETFERVCNYIDLCIEQGIYVIIDWHILYDGDPNEHRAEAVDFFDRISAIYGDTPNIIYEICNEPNGMRFDDETQPVDWEGCVKPYAEAVVAAIRANDPDNIIIIGTPTWSQDVDIVSEDPLEGENLMYTFHFYATSHHDDKREKVRIAHENGLPIFVTEWGTTGDTGGGLVSIEESQVWLDMLEEYNISWCNWSIGGGAGETSNALKTKSSILTYQERVECHWPDEYLSKSGYYVRSQILGIEYVDPDA